MAHDIIPTWIPLCARQTSSAAFTGEVCKKTIGGDDVIFVCRYNSSGVPEYASPTDPSINVADQGGEFTFEETVNVQSVRGDCGDITISVADRDGTHEVTVKGPTAAYIEGNKIVVTTVQKLLISSTAPGWVDVIVTRSDSGF